MSKKKNNKKKPEYLKKGFKSPLELQHSNILKKIAKKHEAQVEYEVSQLPYVLERTYNPDFTITRKDGTVFYVETKGYFRASDRTKLRAVLATNVLANGTQPLVRLVFAADNKLHSKSKMRYSDWCVRNGFEYSIGTIPESWFTE